jgi:mannitol 2-dehydrogenase
MVDRITPATADDDRAWLRDRGGIEDSWPVVAEPFRQWILEDRFAAGRPQFESVGALFTDRVDAWEVYKLRFLNAGHSCLAYLAALAGIELVHEAVAVPELRAFLERLLLEEALPTVEAIPGHPREDYIATVVERFANPGVRDQIARICIDGTAKFPNFLIPSIAGQLERDGPIDGAATALAGWARYLAVVPPERQAFDASAALARRYAIAAIDEPCAFLGLDAVFPPSLRASPRFRAAFEHGYRAIVDNGAVAAVELTQPRRAGDAP